MTAHQIEGKDEHAANDAAENQSPHPFQGDDKEFPQQIYEKKACRVCQKDPRL